MSNHFTTNDHSPLYLLVIRYKMMQVMIHFLLIRGGNSFDTILDSQPMSNHFTTNDHSPLYLLVIRYKMMQVMIHFLLIPNIAFVVTSELVLEHIRGSLSP